MEMAVTRLRPAGMVPHEHGGMQEHKTKPWMSRCSSGQGLLRDETIQTADSDPPYEMST
jgi:hypothetical protein